MSLLMLRLHFGYAPYHIVVDAAHLFKVTVQT